MTSQFLNLVLDTNVVVGAMRSPTKTSTYPLRLPASLKAALQKLSKQDGTSINQFVVTAVAKKISALNTAEFFEERRAKADRKAFRRIFTRKGGEPPRAGDEL